MQYLEMLSKFDCSQKRLTLKFNQFRYLLSTWNFWVLLEWVFCACEKLSEVSSIGAILYSDLQEESESTWLWKNCCGEASQYLYMQLSWRIVWSCPKRGRSCKVGTKFLFLQDKAHLVLDEIIRRQRLHLPARWRSFQTQCCWCWKCSQTRQGIRSDCQMSFC